MADFEALSKTAADEIAKAARDSVDRRGRFLLALSGGKTPRRLYELLCQPPWRGSIPWSQTHIFWTDERFVPRRHRESNYRLVREALLDHLGMPAENIHRMPIEMSSPRRAAAAYEKELKKIIKRPERSSFDLIVLGIGTDGHTASLFPGELDSLPNGRLVISVRGREGRPPVPRLTLSLEAINSGRQTLFLARGSEKLKLIESIRNAGAKNFPAALVRPREKNLFLWAPDAKRRL